MIGALQTKTSATSQASLELSLLSLRLFNTAANQRISVIMSQPKQRSVLQVCMDAQSTATPDTEAADALKGKRELLSGALSLFGQLPPHHQKSPFLVRQALVAAVEVAIQHLSECLVAAASKSPEYCQMLEGRYKLDTPSCVGALYDALSESQKASFAHIVNLLCESISERYVSLLCQGPNGEEELLLLPVSTLNKVVLLCSTFCPSLRYFSACWRQEKPGTTVAVMKRMFKASAGLASNKHEISRTSSERPAHQCLPFYPRSPA